MWIATGETRGDKRQPTATATLKGVEYKINDVVIIIQPHSWLFLILHLLTMHFIHGYSLDLFPDFNGWQNGYGGFTYSFKDKDHLIEYVKNQEEHHKIVTFRDELIELPKEHGIYFDEKYLL